ncbi:hypothetical protein CPSG_00885 [Coccidioides posadasii str. Silveira]|uniref:Uncharacterized protein n=1 Tax=Coccidioides posadasii (strain RMSCC 757 / Silveira) TaxID=443226 RepID=E9CTP6_COCPS|nr:hypothetical protein CPSG_00885 [Coccidioides posadasii str. Silveira]
MTSFCIQMYDVCQSTEDGRMLHSPESQSIPCWELFNPVSLGGKKEKERLYSTACHVGCTWNVPLACRRVNHPPKVWFGGELVKFSCLSESETRFSA